MRLIPLQNSNRVARVDDDDFVRLSQWTWLLRKHSDICYAIRYENKQAILMHQAVLGAEQGANEIDHRDRDGLNNQKNNLRLCSHAQNMQNRKKHSNGTADYKGIYRAKGRNGKGNWIAQISVYGKKIRVGKHKTQEEAARTYDALAREHFGDFARVNFETATNL